MQGRKGENGEEASNVDTAGVDPAAKEGKEGSGGETPAKTSAGWGGKPTFAMMLKQQAAEQAAAPAAPAPAAKEKRTENGHNRHPEARGPRPAAPPAPVVADAHKKAALSAGVWAKEALPPLKEKAPTDAAPAAAATPAVPAAAAAPAAAAPAEA